MNTEKATTAETSTTTDEFAKSELGKILLKEMSSQADRTNNPARGNLTRLYARLSAMPEAERTAHLQGRFDALVDDDVVRPKEILLYAWLLRNALHDECHTDGAAEPGRRHLARCYDFMAQALMDRPELTTEREVATQFINYMVGCWHDTPCHEDATGFLSRLVNLCRIDDMAKHAATEIRHATMRLDALSAHFESLDTTRRAKNDGTDEDAPTRAKFIDSLVHSTTSRLGQNGQRVFMKLMPKLNKLGQEGVNCVMSLLRFLPYMDCMSVEETNNFETVLLKSVVMPVFVRKATNDLKNTSAGWFPEIPGANIVEIQAEVSDCKVTFTINVGDNKCLPKTVNELRSVFKGPTRSHITGCVMKHLDEAVREQIEVRIRIFARDANGNGVVV